MTGDGEKFPDIGIHSAPPRALSVQLGIGEDFFEFKVSVPKQLVYSLTVVLVIAAFVSISNYHNGSRFEK